jgi:hypothetical protein
VEPLEEHEYPRAAGVDPVHEGGCHSA